MEKGYTDISGDEFVKKILEGERDFRRINLTPGFNFSLHEGYEQLKHYLGENKEDLKENPLNLIEARLQDIIMKLDFFDVIARGASFKGSDLSGSIYYGVDFEMVSFYKATMPDVKLLDSNLSRANFFNTYLGNAFFTKSNLMGASFYCANLSDATFYAADVAGVNFSQSDLTRTDLRGVVNL